MSPSGKASEFESDIQRFESFHPRFITNFCPGSSGVEQKTENLCVRGSNPLLDKFTVLFLFGKVAEWLKAPVLKTGI